MQPRDRLSEISTHARFDVTRYAAAIRRYVGAILRDDDAADEVSQALLLKLVRGEIASRWASIAPPRRRFRDYLRTAVYLAAMSYRRAKSHSREQPWALDLAHQPVQQPPEESATDSAWNDEVRRSVVFNAFEKLSEYEQQNPNNTFCTLAKLKAQYPDLGAAALADKLTEIDGFKIAEKTLRVALTRMRERFAQFLVEEVKKYLTPAGLEDLSERDTFREELKDLRLMGYFRDTQDLASNPCDE